LILYHIMRENELVLSFYVTFSLSIFVRKITKEPLVKRVVLILYFEKFGFYLRCLYELSRLTKRVHQSKCSPYLSLLQQVD